MLPDALEMIVDRLIARTAGRARTTLDLAGDDNVDTALLTRKYTDCTNHGVASPRLR